MSESRLIPDPTLIKTPGAISREPVSEPERELNRFIGSMTRLLGPGASESLAELWLNELTCMECVPGWQGFDWRSVSLSASARLASLLIASQFSGSSGGILGSREV